VKSLKVDVFFFFFFEAEEAKLKKVREKKVYLSDSMNEKSLKFTYIKKVKKIDMVKMGVVKMK